MGSLRAPGVQIKEIDLSEVVTPVGTSVGALVGPTYKGPTNRRVLITGNSNFAEVFGKPISGMAPEYPMYCGLEFLKESDFMYFVRPANSEDKVGALELDGDFKKTRATEPEDGEGMWSGEFADGNKANLYYPGEQVNAPLGIVALGASDFNDDIGISIVTENDVETTAMDYTYGYSWKGKYPEKYSDGSPAHYYRINVYKKDHEDTYSDAKWDIQNGKDPTKTLVPVESWIVSNNPLAKDYQGNSMYVKTVINGNSNYIYVNTDGSEFTSAATFATPCSSYEYTTDISVPSTAFGANSSASWNGGLSFTITLPNVTVSAGEVSGKTASVPTVSGYFDLNAETLGIRDYNVAKWTWVSGDNKVIFTAPYMDLVTYTGNVDKIGFSMSGETLTVVEKYSPKFDFDTLEYTSDVPESIVSGGTETTIENTGITIIPLGKGEYSMSNQTAGITNAWRNLFGSKEQCTPNILMAPYVKDKEIDEGSVQAVAELANTRQDCFAVLPIGGLKTTDANELVALTEQMSYARNSYCAMYAGADLVYDQYTNGKIYLPKVCFAGKLLAHNDNVANVWNAPAGLTRGAMNTLDQLKVFTEQEIGFMYNSNINTSKRVRGSGDFMWGQKTGLVKATALDRINVRRLLLYIENSIEPMLNGYLFENNTATLRSRVKSNIDSFMETVFAAGGVYAWNCVCDESNNTAQVIDNNELACDLFISPAKTIEYINVRVIIDRTGVSFTEV